MPTVKKPAARKPAAKRKPVSKASQPARNLTRIHTRDGNYYDVPDSAAALFDEGREKGYVSVEFLATIKDEHDVETGTSEAVTFIPWHNVAAVTELVGDFRPRPEF